MKTNTINLRVQASKKQALLKQAQQENRTITDILLADFDNTPLKNRA